MNGSGVPWSGPSVLVVAAMRSELRPYRRRRPPERTAVIGMGTARSAAGVAAALDEGIIERVVMIGIAGGIGPTVAVGDLVVPEVVLDGASGSELCPHPPPGHRPAGTLHTSDAFVQDPDEVAALVGRGVVALDMETAAVGAVCEARGVPWSVLRGISDHAVDLPVDPVVLDLTGPEGEPRPGAVARFLVTHPHRIPHLARVAKGASAAIAASTDALLAIQQ